MSRRYDARSPPLGAFRADLAAWSFPARWPSQDDFGFPLTYEEAHGLAAIIERKDIGDGSIGIRPRFQPDFDAERRPSKTDFLRDERGLAKSDAPPVKTDSVSASYPFDPVFGSEIKRPEAENRDDDKNREIQDPEGYPGGGADDVHVAPSFDRAQVTSSRMARLGAHYINWGPRSLEAPDKAVPGRRGRACPRRAGSSPSLAKAMPLSAGAVREIGRKRRPESDLTRCDGSNYHESGLGNGAGRPERREEMRPEIGSRKNENLMIKE